MEMRAKMAIAINAMVTPRSFERGSEFLRERRIKGESIMRFLLRQSNIIAT